MDECYFCQKSDLILHNYCWRCYLPTNKITLLRGKDIGHQCKICEGELTNGERCDICDLELSGHNTPKTMTAFYLNSFMSGDPYQELMTERVMFGTLIKNHNPQLMKTMRNLKLTGSNTQMAMTAAINLYNYHPEAINTVQKGRQFKKMMTDLAFALSHDVSYSEDADWIRLFISSAIYLWDLYKGYVSNCDSKFEFYLTSFGSDKPEDVLEILDGDNSFREIVKIVYLLGFGINTNFMGYSAQGRYIRKNIISRLYEIIDYYIEEINKFEDGEIYFGYNLNNLNTEKTPEDFSLDYGFEIYLLVVSLKLAIELLVSENEIKQNRNIILGLLIKLTDFVQLVARKSEFKNNKFISIQISSLYFSITNPLLWHQHILDGASKLSELIDKIHRMFHTFSTVVSPIRFNSSAFNRTYEGLLTHRLYPTGQSWQDKMIIFLLNNLKGENLSELDVKFNMIQLFFPNIHAQLGAGYHNLCRHNLDFITNMISGFPTKEKHRITEETEIVSIMENLKLFNHLPLKLGISKGRMRNTSLDVDGQIIVFTPVEHVSNNHSILLSAKRVEDHLESIKMKPHSNNTTFPEFSLKIHGKDERILETGLPLTRIVLEIEDSGKSWKSVNPDDHEYCNSEYPLIVRKKKGTYKLWVLLVGSQTSISSARTIMHQDYLSSMVIGYNCETELNKVEILDLIINASVLPHNIDKITYHLFSTPPILKREKF